MFILAFLVPPRLSRLHLGDGARHNGAGQGGDLSRVRASPVSNREGSMSKTTAIATALFALFGTTTGTAQSVKHAAGTVAAMTAQQEQQLQSMIAQHESVRSQLSPDDRATLDKLTAHVRRHVFKASAHGDLLGEATKVVNKTIPGLTSAEATTLAQYTLGGIATPAGGSPIGSASGGDGEAQLMAATQQMQETQMSFNLQYLQLQSQMQQENAQFTAVSNILKTKHDAVKKSISNIH